MSTIPTSIQEEHQILHAELAEALRTPGEFGSAARTLAERLHDHFREEEEYAMPQLGALTLLAEGKKVPNAEKIIELSQKLEEKLPHMIADHEEIGKALREFANLAREAGMKQFIIFAEDLRRHARHEEEVLYPAAILVGKCLRDGCWNARVASKLMAETISR